MLARESDDYFRKKGIRRKTGLNDVDAIEDDLLAFLEAARERDAELESSEDPEPE